MNAKEYASAVDALAHAIRPGVWLPVVEAIGIKVNLTKLPCWAEYQKASKRHNCGKTKKQLRSFFRPSLNRRYGREFIAAQAKLQDEFLGVVLERGVE